MTRREDVEDAALHTIKKKLNPVPWPRRVHWFFALFVVLVVLNLLFVVLDLVR